MRENRAGSRTGITSILTHRRNGISRLKFKLGWKGCDLPGAKKAMSDAHKTPEQEHDERLAHVLSLAAAELQRAIHAAVLGGLKVTAAVETMHHASHHYPEPLGRGQGGARDQARLGAARALEIRTRLTLHVERQPPDEPDPNARHSRANAQVPFQGSFANAGADLRAPAGQDRRFRIPLHGVFRSDVVLPLKPRTLKRRSAGM